MEVYIHRINPDYAFTHEEQVAAGWRYVTSLSKDYPIEIAHPFCLTVHKTAAAALDARNQLLAMEVDLSPKEEQSSILDPGHAEVLWESVHSTLLGSHTVK